MREFPEVGLPSASAIGRIRTLGRGMLVGLLVVMVSGCAHKAVQPVPTESTPATRDSTFKPYGDRMVGDVPLAEYMEARVYRLTGNMVPVRSGGNEGPVVGLEVADASQPRAWGWAVPLTDDGYFLTAAHILDKAPDPLYLMNWSSGRMAVSAVRVVLDSWEGIDTEELEELIRTDFAIVHATFESANYVEWAWDWDLRPDVEMVAPGGVDFWPPQLTAGRLISVQAGVEGYGIVRNSPPLGTRVLWHDVHMGGGGSGAPVFLTDGKLAGMTIGGGTTRAPVLRTNDPGDGHAEGRMKVAVAIRPDPDSLKEVIRKDRLQMAADQVGLESDSPRIQAQFH